VGGRRGVSKTRMAEAKDGGDMKLAVLCMTLLFAVFGGIAFVLLRMSGGEEKEVDVDSKQKKKRGARAAGADDEDGSGDEDVDGNDGAEQQGGRNAARDAKRQERQRDNDQAKQMRQERERQQSAKQAAYNQKQNEKDAKMAKQDEAEQKARDDKERAEQEEFDKWKEMFAIEAEGEEDGGAPDAGAVERFVSYIKVRKVVTLEDLAADFQMRTSVARDRLKELERAGRISGIFDDRGKFVYITMEEMTGLADSLKTKGRISRADLVAACNKIVRLDPTVADKAMLQQEASSAADALDETDA